MHCIAIRNIAFKLLKILSRHMLTCLMDNHKCRSAPELHQQLNNYGPFPLLHYQRIQKCNRLKNGKKCNPSIEDERSCNRLSENSERRNHSHENGKRRNGLKKNRKMTPG